MPAPGSVGQMGNVYLHVLQTWRAAQLCQGYKQAFYVPLVSQILFSLSRRETDFDTIPALSYSPLY